MEDPWGFRGVKVSADDRDAGRQLSHDDASPAGAADPPQPAGERLQEIVGLIVSRLRLEELNTTAPADPSLLRVEQTGIDSLELTELIMELEDRFSVTIDDALLTDSTTVVELAEHIAGRMR